MSEKIKQRTVKKQVKASGIGLHTGKLVEISLKPAAANTGIVFQRTDIKADPIKVMPESVISTVLSTQIGLNQENSIGTVEHLMSALYGSGIDNVIVEVNAPELPIFDGSASSFMLLIDSAGVRELPENKKFIKIINNIRVEDGDKFAEFSADDYFSLTLEVDFNHPVIPRQTRTFDIKHGFFKKEISRARTFCFQRDVEYMQSVGLALGGGLDNAVVIGDFAVLNKNGLRYQDEFIRHKVLDCIGDLYMAGIPIVGKFNSRLTGHGLNNKLLRKILENRSSWKYITLPQDITSAPFV